MKIHWKLRLFFWYPWADIFLIKISATLIESRFFARRWARHVHTRLLSNTRSRRSTRSTDTWRRNQPPDIDFVVCRFRLLFSRSDRLFLITSFALHASLGVWTYNTYYYPYITYYTWARRRAQLERRKGALAPPKLTTNTRECLIAVPTWRVVRQYGVKISFFPVGRWNYFARNTGKSHFIWFIRR